MQDCRFLQSEPDELLISFVSNRHFLTNFTTILAVLFGAVSVKYK